MFDKIFLEIKSDQDLMSIFDLHCKEKVVEMFFIYCDPSEVFVPITEWQFNDVSPAEEQDEVEYLRNPLPQNEHASVDKVTMYLDIDDLVCSKKGLELVGVNVEGNVEDDLEDGEDEECEDEDVEDPLEEEPYEEVNQQPVADFDSKDPPMAVDTTYRTMSEFKLALCQHAIKHEFEFNTEMSSKSRFRAYCSMKVKDKCSWRLHASTTADKCTIMVRVIVVLLFY
jgi:hypothetical protein